LAEAFEVDLVVCCGGWLLFGCSLAATLSRLLARLSLLLFITVLAGTAPLETWRGLTVSAAAVTPVAGVILCLLALTALRNTVACLRIGTFIQWGLSACLEAARGITLHLFVFGGDETILVRFSVIVTVLVTPLLFNRALTTA